MPVGIEGQYYFKFSIGDISDFLTESDLESFTLIEETGNMVPTWKMSFSSPNAEIVKYINEGNNLTVQYGLTPDKLISTTLFIVNKQINRRGDNYYNFKLTGTYAAINYLNVPRTRITEKVSAIEVVKAITNMHFMWDNNNVSSSEDKMNWIQPGITDKYFIDNVFLRAYSSDSFYGMGISGDGRVIVRDILKTIKAGYTHRFSPSQTHPDDIITTSNYGLETNSGFINSIFGYKKTVDVLDIEMDITTTYSPDVKPAMALNSTLSRSKDTYRKDRLAFKNDNVHEHYTEAYLKNIQSLALFSTEKLKFSFEKRMTDLTVLDLIMFKEDTPNKKEESLDQVSGLYLVGLVNRTVSGSSFITTVEAYRESQNQTEGNLE